MRPLLFLFICLIFAPAIAADRVALVIGNSNYDRVADLKNPSNDARAVSEALAKHGFEVTTLIDRGRAEMSNDLRRFRQVAVESPHWVVQANC